MEDSVERLKLESAELLKLYELLTREIQSAEAQTYQIVSVGAGAIAAILAAGFNQPNHTLRLFMFLTSYLIIFPMVRLMAGNRSRIWRIATYMRICLEPRLPGIQWETHLAGATALSRASTFVPSSQMLVVQLATVVVGVVTFVDFCVVAKWTFTSFVPGSVAFSHVAVIAAGIAVLANGAIVYYETRIDQRLHRGGPIEQHWWRTWEALQEARQAVNRTGSQ